MMRRAAAWLVAAACFAPVAAAQDDDKAAGKIIALTGGKVVTVSGRTFRRGTVLIKDGKIDAVGEDVIVPEGAEVVDCRGKVVTPGFVPALAWGIGLTTGGGFPFAADARDDEHDDGHGHQHGAFGHDHNPGCLCSDIDWLYRIRRPDMGQLQGLGLSLPGGNLMDHAVTLRMATEAVPFIRPISEKAFFYPGLEAETIKDSLNPYVRDVVMANAVGVTTTWLPSTGGFSIFAMLFGQAAPPTAGTGGVVVKMARDRLDEMFVSKGRFLVMDFRRLAGSKRFNLLRELADTRRYRKELADHTTAKADYTKAKADYRKAKKEKKKDLGPEPKKPKKPKKPSAAAKWLPLFEKKRALRVWAETVSQIRLALHIAERYGVEVVIDDCTEGWAIAGEVARAGVSVVLNPRRIVARTIVATDAGGSIYRHGSSIENAAILSKSGVKVALVPPAPAFVLMGIPGRDLFTFPLDAAFAVRGGMPRAEAMKAITLNAAEILGQEATVGSLEKGKSGDVVVLDGDPFDHKTFVERTYVNGRLVYEKSKEPLFDYVKRGKVVKPMWEFTKPGK